MRFKVGLGNTNTFGENRVKPRNLHNLRIEFAKENYIYNLYVCILDIK